MIARSLSRNGWELYHLPAAVCMTLVGFAVTMDAWIDIAHIASVDEEASHIFLVPIVVAWLVWVRRGRIRQCSPTGQYVGSALVAIGWLFIWIGYGNAMQAVWHMGAVVLVVGCLLSVLGIDVLRRFLPAFAVLVFLVPIPGMFRSSIAIPLQTATAGVTQAVFDFIRIGVTRSGNVLNINGVVVGIAEACNGLRMVFALMLVSYTFAFATPLRHYVRVIVIAASPVSAIGCNVIRLVPTVWFYGNRSKEFADTFHTVSGWCMLLMAFLILMAIIRLLRWALIPVTRYTLAYD